MVRRSERIRKKKLEEETKEEEKLEELTPEEFENQLRKVLFINLPSPKPSKKRKEPENTYGPFLPKEKKLKKVKFNSLFENLEELIQFGETYDPSFSYSCNLNIENLHKIIEPLKELNAMIGLHDFKKIILDQIIYLLTLDPTKDFPMLHTCIYGPSGVGKTHISKILAKIYASCGVLSKNKFKVVKREDFVGGFLGHTAIRTRMLLEESLGSVLFLDEAYSMGSGGNRDSFAKEAIDTINAFLSENYKDFIMIIAGYKEDIERCFFKQNQGLNRRFPYRFTIKGYSPKELAQIFQKFVKDEKLTMPEINLEPFFSKHKKYFPHYGGDIKVLLDKVKTVHSKKLILIDKQKWNDLSLSDLEEGFELYIQEREVKEDDSYLTMFM